MKYYTKIETSENKTKSRVHSLLVNIYASGLLDSKKPTTHSKLTLRKIEGAVRRILGNRYAVSTAQQTTSIELPKIQSK